MATLVVAVDREWGIGKNNSIPWHLSADLAWFKKITDGGVLVCGPKTAQTLPLLPGRSIKVISRRGLQLNEALENENVFIIGGGTVYASALPYCSDAYVTHVKGVHGCDVFCPRLSGQWIAEEVLHDDKDFTLVHYRKTIMRNPDRQYFRLIDHCIVRQPNRTGVDAYVGHPISTTYIHFPLLTTKRVPVRLVVEELLWMLRGSTNVKELQRKKVHIWDGNSTEEFLRGRNLPWDEGDIGPAYGFQFRHAGAEYKGCNEDYTGKGVDQVARALHLLKTDPYNRRIIIDLWNPEQNDQMALPPCHAFYQFIVVSGRLHISLTQRSGDIGLGVPFNLVSAWCMMRMFAALSGLEPGTLTHTINCPHVYVDHYEPLQEQMQNEPRAIPHLSLINRGQEGVEDFQVSDFVISGYSPHSSVKMKMAV